MQGPITYCVRFFAVNGYQPALCFSSLRCVPYLRTELSRMEIRNELEKFEIFRGMDG